MRKSAVIAIIIAGVTLSTGILLLYLWPEAEPETESLHPVSTPSYTLADLINESPEEISAIQFIPRENEPYTLSLDPANGDVELDSANVIFPTYQYVLRAIFMNTISLLNVNRVTDAADDVMLASWGFDEPEMTICLERVDGTSIELVLGTIQAAGQGRYARIQESREVFLLDERQGIMLTHQLEDLYDFSFFPIEIFPDAEAVIYTIDHILLEVGNEVLEIQRREDEELEGLPFGSSRFQTLKPFAGEGNDHVIQSVILENAALIMPGSIEAINPTDLSVYGLNDPVRLTLSSGDWSSTILVGDRSSDGEGRYVMIEGYNAVLLDSYGDYSFISIDSNQLRPSTIWLHFIGDVSSVTFVLDGVTRILRFEHDQNEDSLQGWLDGVELSDENARRLYIGALNIIASGGTDEPVPTDILPVYTFLMSFEDGGTDRVDLYPIGDAQFLITRNGESTGLFITRMSLQQNILRRFEILDAGGDIPSM